MARLTDVIEARTAELVAEVRGGPAVRATLIPDPVSGSEASPTSANPTVLLKP